MNIRFPLLSFEIEKNMKKIIVNLIFGLLALTLGSGSMAGSFHYEIDVMSELMADPKGNLEGVQMSWLYDEKMTKILLQGEDISPGKKQQTLDALGKRIMKDLNGVSYFTRLQMKGKRLNVTSTPEMSVELIENKYLRLFFWLPLAQPVDVHNAKISMSLADPNGAAMLFYDSAERISLDDRLVSRCRVSLFNHEEFAHGEAAQRVDVSCK